MNFFKPAQFIKMDFFWYYSADFELTRKKNMLIQKVYYFDNEKLCEY